MAAIQVFLTRPQGRNGEVPARLAALGMQVHELPALELRPLPLPAATPRPHDYDIVVFVSRYAAQRYLSWFAEAAPAPACWPETTLAATVGASSGRALRDSGLIPAACIIHPAADVPGQDSEALLAELQARGTLPRRVLIVRGTQGREWLTGALTGMGARVERLAVYERVPAVWPHELGRTVCAALQQPQHCVFLLTSSEGVRATAQRLESLGCLAQWSEAGFVVLHERIGATLQSVLALQPGCGARRLELCMPDDDSIVNVIRAVARSSGKTRGLQSGHD